MSSFTNYLEQQALGLAFGNVAEKVISTYYIALADYATESMDDFYDYEVAAGDYSRKAYSNDTSSSGWILHGSGLIKNKGEIVFSPAVFPWGEIGYFAICRHPTEVTGIVAYGLISPVQTINPGDRIIFPTGSIRIYLN